MDYNKKIESLVNNFKKCLAVTKLSDKKEDQEYTLANSLVDIEESAKKIINIQLPKLYLETLEEEEVEDIILDIGEELRHILYHIRETKVYDYLID